MKKKIILLLLTIFIFMIYYTNVNAQMGVATSGDVGRIQVIKHLVKELGYQVDELTPFKISLAAFFLSIPPQIFADICIKVSFFVIDLNFLAIIIIVLLFLIICFKIFNMFLKNIIQTIIIVIKGKKEIDEQLKEPSTINNGEVITIKPVEDNISSNKVTIREK
ncbi:MAG: hypothetical protein QMC67_13140 [Candidatus Wallbacteria bacterium]